LLEGAKISKHSKKIRKKYGHVIKLGFLMRLWHFDAFFIVASVLGMFISFQKI
jgi:hypothetical protein